MEWSVKVFFLNYFVLASVFRVYSRNIVMNHRAGDKTLHSSENFFENVPEGSAQRSAVARPAVARSAKVSRASDPSPRKVFDERDSEHWKMQAQWVLKLKVAAPLNTRIAKNVILFLGDGMSVATLSATRTYLGNRYGYSGEELKLSFEAFPYTGLAKTYCVDSNVADSACSGTAYLSGVKANSGTVGLSGAVKKGDCEAQKSGKYTVTGLMDWAQQVGKATGVVTTTRVTHATPAAAYAHTADRRWESDADMPPGVDCEDIASQLVRGGVGSKIDVILGGGRRNFYPDTEKDTEGIKGHRKDKYNLVEEWLKRKESLGAKPKYIHDKKGLMKLNHTQFNSVLGLFSPDHMPYHLEANEDVHPTLAEMTLKAINILKKKKEGFFLFVEGGRIDTAHHETKARKALDETAELAKAVEAAMKAVNADDTLIVVTSDHSHTMTYNGYSKRGSDILGFVNKQNASDSLPYTTLSYATGPGYRTNDNNYLRYNLLNDDLSSPNYTYPSLFPLGRETHGGEDVAVFARGPWAHLFTGNYEQNYLPHALAFAACIGQGFTACNSQYSI